MGWLHANFAFAESLIGLLNSLSAVDCIRAMIDVLIKLITMSALRNAKLALVLS